MGLPLIDPSTSEWITFSMSNLESSIRTSERPSPSISVIKSSMTTSERPSSSISVIKSAMTTSELPMNSFHFSPSPSSSSESYKSSSTSPPGPVFPGKVDIRFCIHCLLKFRKTLWTFSRTVTIKRQSKMTFFYVYISFKYLGVGKGIISKKAV